MIEGQAAADHRVLFPPRRPLGKGDLRFQDLLEQRIFPCFLLHDLVIDLQLSLQDCFRRLVEFNMSFVCISE